jgi:beta-lactamase regulating signal transducer with metallopeptidase domain
MESELLEVLLRLNLVAGAAITLVLGVRPLIRAQFGARAARALWLIVPVASVAARAAA